MLQASPRGTYFVSAWNLRYTFHGDGTVTLNPSSWNTWGGNAVYRARTAETTGGDWTHPFESSAEYPWEIIGDPKTKKEIFKWNRADDTLVVQNYNPNQVFTANGVKEASLGFYMYHTWL